MGESMSTLAGWGDTIKIFGIWGIIVIGGCHYLGIINLRDWLPSKPQAAAIAHAQSQKEARDKAKIQRAEAYKKAKKDSDKVANQKTPSVPVQPTSSKPDDGSDDRAFALQFASIRQGTNINAPKKSEEKRLKSVKQSRIRSAEDRAEETKVVSAPSSNAGADADVSESPFASPEVQAADAGDVSDMLEPTAPGPSVLRLTDTDKVKQKANKTKAPEKVETKKQRQNRQKAEADKALREEAEKERQVKLEAQRRLARISEGRPAKDGSEFMKKISQPQQSVWTGQSNGINHASSSSSANGDFVPVQPLDTFDTSSHTDVSAPKVDKVDAADNWKAPALSEEEQMELLRNEEAWSTVKTKKPNKSKKVDDETAESANEAEPTTAKTEPQTVAPKVVKSGASRPSVKFSQQSSFAALSNDQSDEVEQEWDV